MESDDLKEDLIKKIVTVLDLLPKKMKKIVKMKYLKNKKHREIAESLCITENTVNTQLTRAKKNYEIFYFDMPEFRFGKIKWCLVTDLIKLNVVNVEFRF